MLHIDLNGIDYTVEGNLHVKLNRILEDYENQYGLHINDTEPAVRFSKLISGIYETTGRPVVVLADEYDRPVIDNIDRPILRERNRDTLRGFYSVLKSSDRYLQLVFLTGVTKFGQMNVFSRLNNIRDISLKPDYDTICGITELELESNFKDGIEKLAKAENTDFDGLVSNRVSHHKGL